MLDIEKIKNMLNLSQNEYFDMYIKLIEANRETVMQRFKTQKHHIIPKYYYRKNKLKVDDSSSNTINLTYIDHIRAHCYLAMASIDSKDRYSNFIAIDKLCGEKYLRDIGLDIKSIISSIDSNNHDIMQAYENRRLYMSSLQKQRWIKLSEEEQKHKLEKFNTSGKIIMTNEAVEVRVLPEEIDFYINKGFRKGRKISCIEKIRASRKGQPSSNIGKKMSPEAKIKRMITFNKRKAEGRYVDSFKQTQECKDKISAANKNNIYVYKGSEIRRVKACDVEKFLQDGWIKGNPKAKTNSDMMFINDGINMYRLPRLEAEKLLTESSNFKKGSLRVWIHKDNQNKKVSITLLGNYLNAGWVKGQIKGKK